MRTILSWLLLAAAAVAQQDLSDAIIKEATEKSQVMDHLDILVNEIGPRLTSSDNLTKACEWARDRFASYGLEARLEEWGTFPVGFNRGPWSGVMIRPERRRLTFCTPSWTPGTDGPVTAEAVAAPENEDFDPESLRGKWVLQIKRPKRDVRKKLEAAYDEVGIAGLIRRNAGELIVTSGNPRIDFDNLPTRVTIDMLKVRAARGRRAGAVLGRRKAASKRSGALMGAAER